MDDTPTSTNLFVRDVSLANLTLILNLDELALCDEAEDLDNVTDDLVCWYSLDQLDLIVCLEVSHLVLALTNDLKIVDGEH